MQAALFRLQQLGDKDGQVPGGAQVKAIRRLNQMRAGAGLAAKVAGLPVGPQVEAKQLLPAKSNLSAGGWTWLGPGNIGGRTRSLLVHPRQTNLLWAGACGGGVWTSTDAGGSWLPCSDFMASLAITCLAMHPRKPDVLYAGTGEGFFNIGAIRGCGIFRSTDGGSTWALLESTAGEAFAYVNRLSFSADGEVLLAATRKGLYRSGDGGASWTPPGKLVNVPILDVRCHPTDPRRCVAGGYQGGAFVSNDGGATWALAQGIPTVTSRAGESGRTELTYARAKPDVVYASVDRGKGELYRSDDGGQTYAQANGGSAYLGGQGWYGNVVWADDPTDADLVVVGGVELWRSTDGGKTLARISDLQEFYAGRSAHSDQHVIVAHTGYNGKTNRTVYFGNDGGVYRADDIREVSTGAGWRALNNNYGVTQFYWAAGNPRSGTIIAGAQDNGTLRYTREGGPNGWTWLAKGDGGACAADPTDPKIFYGEHQYLWVHRSKDGGETSQEISEGIEEAGNTTVFIGPLLLDPNDPRTLLVGGRRLWRTTNARDDKPSWSAIKPEVDNDRSNRKANIGALAVAPGNSDVIWVGHADGALYKTTNGTAAQPEWARIDDGRKAGDGGYCECITIDPRDSDHVLVTSGGYRRGNIRETSDGGRTWRVLGEQLPEAPVWSLVLHPRDRRLVYAGTEVGVFASEDGGKTWSPTNEGPTNCPVYQLFWMRDVLVAVTYGRGLFEIKLP
jgi:photosystem II stability/assembly factor-like uncharacterized protein